MADQTPPPKPAPVAQPTSPEEIVALYNIIQEREWDKEGKSYKNPINVMRSLLHYGRLAASRLVDIYKRVAAVEGRVKALEDFKVQAEAQEAMKALETALSGVSPPPNVTPERLADTKKHGEAPTTPTPLAIVAPETSKKESA